jgi:hypothetical protein
MTKNVKIFKNSVLEPGLMDMNEGETNKGIKGRSVFLQVGGRIEKNE